jgi:hypothetical protein
MACDLTQQRVGMTLSAGILLPEPGFMHHPRTIWEAFVWLAPHTHEISSPNGMGLKEKWKDDQNECGCGHTKQRESCSCNEERPVTAITTRSEWVSEWPGTSPAGCVVWVWVWVWTQTHTQANTQRQTNNKDTDRKYRIGSATKKQKKQFCKDKRTTEKWADSPRFTRNMLVHPPQNN